jgi:predicted dehydrogenase
MKQISANEKLQVAVIGTGGQGLIDIKAMLGQPDIQIAAICDVNAECDNSKFWYGGVAGREPAKKVVEEYYGGLDDKANYQGCPAYIDFRVMLEKEKNINAVLIATPDHVHAAACLWAIHMGKHVYCEKPLAHSIDEVRRVTEAAREAGVATQMGNQGHSGEGIRLICEWIWDGAIGPVREVHSWTVDGGWIKQSNRPEETPPVPNTLEWDLWLGPAPYRPYHPIYLPYNWRGWWDFGSGGIGDMACHNLDSAFWALHLGHPVSVEASSTPISTETTPLASTIHFKFPARGDMPPVTVSWYDGGVKPPRPDELEEGRGLGDNGILFIGDSGKILCDGWSRSPRLIPESRMQEYKRPPKTLERSKGHLRDWIDACKGGKQASSNFDCSGLMTEVILLGNVALRTGKKLYWDGAAMKATNAPEAEAFIKPAYRAGWGL